MAVYTRPSASGKPLYWISYSVTDALRARFGLSRNLVREPAQTGDKKVAAMLLAQRNREVVAGTWAPRGDKRGGNTVRDYGERWLASRELSGVRSVRNEAARLRMYVFPVLGERRMTEVRRQDVRELVDGLQRRVSERTGKRLSPRMVHRVYEDMRGMFAQALEVDEIIPATPCTLRQKRGELPAKKDADPRWRSGAVYTHLEVEALIGDERVPEYRRVLYALMFLGGMRVGEAVGRTWGDYDGNRKPLAKLNVATQYDGDELKTERPRDVPVHESLAKMLRAWAWQGWEAMYGRLPGPDDFIVPNPSPRKDSKRYIDKRLVWKWLQRDLQTLKLRKRRSHDARRTFVTLARDGGADPSLLRWVSHGPTASMVDLYTSPPWEALCRQVACIDVRVDGLSLPVG